ncbi:caveolae-associated protein 2b [Nematolebias whitei]|uniref:caveolae-associated protein 2b n=1 Tax=Nematolebias whitei TaxID=451745 RepID=UPI00189C3109|nr:caveolae-associated protein 2b [Nematolebias whitei]
MVTTEPHQSQDLMVPHENQNQEEQASPSSAVFDLEKFSQGPVNAITVLTLLDKLVNMLDAVQENQHKMELHQVEMEGVVKGIQADMTKLAKSHTHTSNTVSKLLDKSRKLSVTMKEVRERMERQGAQVKKLEANHAHLISRNNFKVLIFQEENEIPTTVFVKTPPPFPRDDNLEEDEPPAPGVSDSKQEATFKTIDLSSDEDVGLEADLEEEDMWSQDLENLEQSKAEKLKRSSMKRVDSLKKAFSKQNIEKKMTKIGTKLVSAEQREKIKQKTASLKFGIRKPRSSSDSQPPEASAKTEDSPTTEADIQVSPPGSIEQEVPFTDVHAELVPAEQQDVVKEEEEEKLEEMKDETKEAVIEGSVVVEADMSVVSEEVNEEYALSSTLPQEERGAEEKHDES